MLSTFAAVATYLKLRQHAAHIDNFAFKLHYRWTFSILIVCTILVCARQYIGSHIECISEGAIPTRVINTFCFFTATYTIVDHLNKSSLQSESIPHPGVGPDIYGKDSIKRHAYYQWVPFVLFAQAICFYLTHSLWKHIEDERIERLVAGLKHIKISPYIKTTDKLTIAGRSYPSRDMVDSSANIVKVNFLNRFKVNTYWAKWLILCEFLNLFNVLVQIHFANKFLAGQFLGLGSKVVSESWDQMDILDVVFPKVTKCTFRKFGPSGTIQVHDSLCVMALNIVNEKIYTFLWFWFLILLAASLVTLMWRFATVFLRKSSAFNAKLFAYACPGRLDRKDIDLVSQNCSFSNWLFLYYIAKNMDNHVFKQVLRLLAEEFCRCNQKEKVENVINQLVEDDDGNSDSWEKPKSIDSVDSAVNKLLYVK